MVDHEHTPKPVCPYCGHIDKDAWEIDYGANDTAEVTCGVCDVDYKITRYVGITYTTEMT
jgi:hypothetical protein